MNEVALQKEIDNMEEPTGGQASISNIINKSPASWTVRIHILDKVPLTPSNVPTKSRLNNQNTFREKCKNVIYFFFFNLKWPPFRRNLSNQAQILHCTLGPTKICVCKISHCKIEGARSRKKICEHILDPTVAASNQSNTYRFHTSCGT